MQDFHEEEDGYFCRFTFGQFVSLATLEVVALFFVFYLGARYGPDLFGQASTQNPEEMIEFSETDPAPRIKPEEVEYTYPKTLTRKEEKPEVPSIRPQPKPKPAPAASPPPVTPPPVQEGKYSIQVGSYQKAAGAAEKVNQWQAKGYDAYLSIGEVQGSGTWYRVRVGRFENRRAAQQLLQQIKTKEKANAIIVRSGR